MLGLCCGCVCRFRFKFLHLMLIRHISVAVSLVELFKLCSRQVFKFVRCNCIFKLHELSCGHLFSSWIINLHELLCRELPS